MALASGRPPLNLLGQGTPDTWTDLDLEVVSQWRTLQNTRCVGCGRPLSQHLHNPRLGREETPEDYIPYTVECPALQAMAGGQEMWRTDHKAAMSSYHEGTGPDPTMGVHWITQGPGESLPS